MMLTINDKKKRIYFLAICGTAMASLAAMLKAKGYSVYGVDEGVYPPMSDFLAEQAISAFEGFDAAHLDPAPDLVVVGNAISRGNVEIEEILDRHIHYISLPDALREFIIRGKRSIVVTGTHGKTTTTSLLSHIFETAGRSPSFFIGGIPNNFKRGFQLGAGDDIIIEGDEYDSAFFDKAAKFLRYMPDIGVINAVEYDHADIYSSIEEIKLAFRRFVNLIPRNGLLAACADDANVMQVVQKAFCPVVTFGLTGADWHAEELTTTEEGMSFNVLNHSRFVQRISTSLVGNHHVRNILACHVVADAVGIAPSAVQQALSSFAGVKRRLEFKGMVRGIKIYDDFGHHPTAVRETLAACRAQHPGKQIWAFYEPRSATSRRNVFQNEFVDAFNEADVVLIAPVHRPDKAPQDQLFSTHLLAEELKKKGKTSATMDIKGMVDFARQHAQDSDIIVTFSNGPFGNIHQILLNSL
ncbi:MAG: UDP-N-acetylmuramate:L-alanyl-gamma-D-glutamyl-meso-diaminopimelate ligase [Calditrichaeota bacterium]|nr:MAG: UDP-N-acetylmuramate:L-alanyl-gamma-D-glutamyl-meso-diaminopimelate ligase [Calditrichota bacterium]